MHFQHFTTEQLRRLVSEADLLGLSDGAKERLQWFLHYTEQNNSISETCTHFGIARSTFHRWANRFDPADPQTLEEQSRRPLRVRGTTASPQIVERIREYRLRWPMIGKESIAQMLSDELRMPISGSMVGRIIDQYCFYFADTPLHRKKRSLHAPVQVSAGSTVYRTESYGNYQASYDAWDRPSHDAHAAQPRYPRRRHSVVVRSLIVASVLTNIAFVAIILGMAGLEMRFAEQSALSASATTRTTEHIDPTRTIDAGSGDLLHLEVIRMHMDGERKPPTQNDIDSITSYLEPHD